MHFSWPGAGVNSGSGEPSMNWQILWSKLKINFLACYLTTTDTIAIQVIIIKIVQGTHLEIMLSPPS